jgi:hypothetical protein
MPGSWPQRDHPLLTDTSCKVTSASSYRYNCIAWAAGDDKNAWWPSRRPVGYWPRNVPREETIDAFIEAYRTLGYEVCNDGSLEAGSEKIAIYGALNPANGSIIPTHAALQLESGKWTSKMGSFEDIVHNNVNDVNGSVYGIPRRYMSRPRR